MGIKKLHINQITLENFDEQEQHVFLKGNDCEKIWKNIHHLLDYCLFFSPKILKENAVKTRIIKY